MGHIGFTTAYYPIVSRLLTKLKLVEILFTISTVMCGRILMSFYSLEHSIIGFREDSTFMEQSETTGCEVEAGCRSTLLLFFSDLKYWWPIKSDADWHVLTEWSWTVSALGTFMIYTPAISSKQTFLHDFIVIRKFRRNVSSVLHA